MQLGTRKFRVLYMNAPDKSDPLNKIRVLCAVLFGQYVKLTWEAGKWNSVTIVTGKLSGA